MRSVFLFALILVLGSTSPAPAQTFENHWHDGKAELDGYRLVVSRYGEERAGTAVMIYVTEPFRESTRVKADHPDQNPGDVLDVIKLNMVRDFQTGIYDYNTMVSVFSRTDNFSAIKTSFSSAEWCGHVYEEQIYRAGNVEGTRFSYFEGESGAYTLPYPDNGVVEDNLFILLRGLKGDVVAPGRTKTLPFLPGTFAGRLAHQQPAWTEIDISRRPRNETVSVPAGEFHTRVVDVQVKGGKHGTFYMENDYPHRIVKWELEPDVRGELTGTLRVPYWTLHDNGHEGYLTELGLK